MNDVNITREEHPFAPIVFPDSRLLILGSLPSVRSRAEEFYYLHPRNRFWQVMSLLLEEDFVQATTTQKIDLLKKHRIALYDIVKSCLIKGSGDGSIREVRVTDIPALIVGTQIERIVLNGRKTAELFFRFYPELQEKAIVCPSTSPANAIWTLPRLVEAWRIIRP